jgi:hypothetical protein
MSQDCGRIFAYPVKTGKEVLRKEQPTGDFNSNLYKKRAEF